MKSKDGKGNCIASIGTVCVTVDCTGCRNFTTRDECSHGHLRRKCDICSRDEEIEKLSAQADRMREHLVEAESILRHIWSKAAVNPFPVPFEQMTRRWREEFEK